MPKNGISNQKQKEWTSLLNSHARISIGTKFQLKVTILMFWTKCAKKECSQWATKKREYLHWFLHSRISVPTKFWLQLVILTFWSIFSPKGYFILKTKKMNITLNSACSNYSSYQILTSTDKFDFFDQICTKRRFAPGNKKRESHHWIPHIRISLGSKFQHKVTIVIFPTKFAQKGNLHSKTKKENNIIEFRIFELV